MMFLYAISSACYRADDVYKLGRTHNPSARLSTLLTGCAPGRAPSHDLDFEALWLTRATSDRELDRYERILHARFARYRMMHKIPGDCEWFDFCNNAHTVAHPVDEIEQFLAVQPWIVRRLTRAEITSMMPITRPSRFMKRQIPINECFIEDDAARIRELNAIQEPIIATICKFITAPTPLKCAIHSFLDGCVMSVLIDAIIVMIGLISRLLYNQYTQDNRRVRN